MKPSKSLERFVHKHVEGLCICMSLTHYDIKLVFCNIKDADMNIEVDHRYMEALIRIDTKRAMLKLVGGAQDVILAALCHEIAHIVTSEMVSPFMWKGEVEPNPKKINEHFEERVTETVSRWALRLYKLENGL